MHNACGIDVPIFFLLFLRIFDVILSKFVLLMLFTLFYRINLLLLAIYFTLFHFVQLLIFFTLFFVRF